MEERQDFMIEEGLRQAVVLKLSHGAPDLKEHQYRIFPWSIGYNPKEETTLVVVWISLSNLSLDLFAKKSMLFIASAVGKPIAIDKTTQIKSRPSTTRVKFVDEKSGKLIEVFQEIVYDNLLLYCNYCALKGTTDSEKYHDDVREILNEKRKTVDVDQSKATSLDQQLVASTSKQNRVDLIDVDTSNIGVQTTTKNKGDCNNQHAATNEGGTPRVGVDAPRVDSGQKLMDSGQKLMDTSDLEDAKNLGSMFCNEKGPTGNIHDSEKMQNTSSASRDLLCSNSFDALLKTIGKQVRLTENDNDLIQEKQVSPPTLNSKLSPKAPVFVPKYVLEKNNESRALLSNTIDLGKDSLDEDGVDLGEDSLDEDEEDNMLDIFFDRVAREDDISPRATKKWKQQK
ncbi:hypothetical protein H5410_060032 [Solanum commersonii]|uniref:DUF4283 domain-containing protein n=1 Tax=Solanum commersonii TaxID=4109 RepID=A0A9J5W439_SOLCO|nr:hypothetical protein H5410_060032 [Solanum commersonii]